MRFVIVSDLEMPLSLVDPEKVGWESLFVTPHKSLARKARGEGFATATGALDDERLYRRIKISPRDRILVHLSSGAAVTPCVRVIRKVCKGAAITLLVDNAVKCSRFSPDVRCVELAELTRNIGIELEKAASIRSMIKLRELFKDAERVLLLLQDDPDPDGIASAMALRTLLGRNRLTAPIGSFGQVTRPENQAMTRLLEIDIQQLRPADLGQYSHIALLDVQPFHSPDIPTKVHAVIDHHPRRTNYTAQFRDIRPRYGATSTIMTEYMMASNIPISQRLATALLYGIKTDTQLLGRAATPMDVEAFAELYPLANHAMLRRIDRPQIPRGDLVSFAAALAGSEIDQDVIFAHLGPLVREDVIPYFADLCLEVENVEWSVTSGVFDGQLIISVRNYGVGRAAGEIVKAAFESFGSAGGHRTMAKAVIPLTQLPETCHDHAEWVKAQFLSFFSQREAAQAE